MAYRITEADIKATVARINRAMHAPQEPYTKTEDGSYHANIGNYHISGAYGGVSLHKMLTNGGGVTDVFMCGHIPKKDLYGRMQAFLQGHQAEQKV